MPVTIVIHHGDLPSRRKAAVQPIVDKYAPRRRFNYRINLWSVDEGRKIQKDNRLAFIPCGKVTQEETGKIHYLRMRNGKMKEVQ